jgi:hypothetical protein
VSATTWIWVSQVWLLAPKIRTAIVCEANTMVEQTTGELSLPGSKIRLSIDQIFSVLDEG